MPAGAGAGVSAASVAASGFASALSDASTLTADAESSSFYTTSSSGSVFTATVAAGLSSVVGLPVASDIVAHSKCLSLPRSCDFSFQSLTTFF